PAARRGRVVAAGPGAPAGEEGGWAAQRGPVVPPRGSVPAAAVSAVRRAPPARVAARARTARAQGVGVPGVRAPPGVVPGSPVTSSSTLRSRSGPLRPRPGVPRRPLGLRRWPRKRRGGPARGSLQANPLHGRTRSARPGELRAGERASRGTEVQGSPRQLRRGDGPLSGARSGEGIAGVVRVFPRRLPWRCPHVQDRTPASTDVGGPPQRSGVEPASRRPVSAGGRFVPVRAGPKSRLRRRLERPRNGSVRAGQLRGGAS